MKQQHDTPPTLERLISLKLASVFQWVLNIALIILAIILVSGMIRELYTITRVILSTKLVEVHDSDLPFEAILVFFLYFEFVALIIKYFYSSYHFPLRYFIYVGITAIVRLIILSHENAVHTLYYCGAILILVLALYLAEKKSLINRTNSDETSG